MHRTRIFESRINDQVKSLTKGLFLATSAASTFFPFLFFSSSTHPSFHITLSVYQSPSRLRFLNRHLYPTCWKVLNCLPCNSVRVHVRPPSIPLYLLRRKSSRRRLSMYRYRPSTSLLPRNLQIFPLSKKPRRDHSRFAYG